MVQIITDSSSLYTGEEGKKLGVISIPLCISIGQRNFRDLEIPTEEFVAEIQAGSIPISSQPPIGDVLEAYENSKGFKVINISLADGLSGTYQTACTAREMSKNRDDITVLNTKTLCGPHRYLVECAAAMVKEGKNETEIIRTLEEKIQHTKSFLIPQDFDFLRRGGRLSPTAAFVGSLLDIKPILILNKSGTSLDKFGMARTMKGAAKTIFKQMKKDHVGCEHILYIVHGAVPETAKQIKEMAEEEFPGIDVRIHLLSHVFITHGGPGCVALQYIRK
jgi:DegV family protein with EDD domain